MNLQVDTDLSRLQVSGGRPLHDVPTPGRADVAAEASLNERALRKIIWSILNLFCLALRTLAL